MKMMEWDGMLPKVGDPKLTYLSETEVSFLAICGTGCHAFVFQCQSEFDRFVAEEMREDRCRVLGE
jgi:hypothetical protein